MDYTTFKETCLQVAVGEPFRVRPLQVAVVEPYRLTHSNPQARLFEGGVVHVITTFCSTVELLLNGEPPHTLSLIIAEALVEQPVTMDGSTCHEHWLPIVAQAAGKRCYKVSLEAMWKRQNKTSARPQGSSSLQRQPWSEEGVCIVLQMMLGTLVSALSGTPCHESNGPVNICHAPVVLCLTAIRIDGVNAGYRPQQWGI